MIKLVKNEFFGITITLLGGILWGFSGVCGQYLFTQKGISSDWLVPYRLLLAGFALVVYYFITSPKSALAPIKDIRLLPQMLIYAILGLMLTQYSYFYAIELSNAAVATVIQYSAPALILAVVCVIEKRSPKINELIALILASLGVILLATHGDLTTLVISPKALFYCLLSAVCVCIYNLLPTRLNKKYPITLNLGWGMVIGGVLLAFFMRVWNLNGVSDVSGFLAFISVVFFGTICAFSFYMVGVKSLGASKASLIACIEPVSAALFAYFWLGTEFVFLDFTGFVLIISCIFLLAKKDKQ
ncbi:DMT family transporter [Campylobacter californiensis]|uniref:DMT family transporter n=1 Tax=Campylobacter californiensis TaxID=1032243 RepID=UPI0014756D91|nr:DMT family transporter [Campylobacter sp. RM12916]MBE3609560.1 EamA family transporter [Campylobacter sp. RM12916]